VLKQLPGAGNTAEQVGIRAPRGVDFAISHPLALEALVTALTVAKRACCCGKSGPGSGRSRAANSAGC